MDNALLLESPAPQPPFPKPCLVIDPELSFELDIEEDEPKGLRGAEANPQGGGAKVPKPDFQFEARVPTKEAFSAQLNATLNKCGILREEIASAALGGRFVEVGITVNLSRNCFLVQPRREILMHLENLLFVECPAELLPLLWENPRGALGRDPEAPRFLLLGEVDDVFGKLESPLYKVRESPLLQMARGSLEPHLRVFAIETKMSQITEQDILEMKAQKKSDASGQFDRELDQGYAPATGLRFGSGLAPRAQLLRGKRGNPCKSKSDLDIIGGMDMFGKSPIKLRSLAAMGPQSHWSKGGKRGGKSFRSKRVKTQSKSDQRGFMHPLGTQPGFAQHSGGTGPFPGVESIGSLGTGAAPYSHLVHPGGGGAMLNPTGNLQAMFQNAQPNGSTNLQGGFAQGQSKQVRRKNPESQQQKQ